MMCAVSDTDTSEEAARDGGVLTNLPRTRPQRSSARRAAARGASPANGRARKPPASKRAAQKPRRRTASPTRPASMPDSTVPEPTIEANARGRSNPPVRATRPSAATKRSAAPRRAAPRKSRSPALDEAAPRQGFESDAESSRGSVAPPGGPELVATAAEIVGELAKAGLSTGERLFKDVLSRLPLS